MLAAISRSTTLAVFLGEQLLSYSSLLIPLPHPKGREHPGSHSHWLTHPSPTTLPPRRPRLLAMSSLAASVILHPKLSQGLALLATTIGRDKVSSGMSNSQQPDRSGCQCGRFHELTTRTGLSLLKRGDTDAAARWEGLKNGLAMGRRSEWCRVESSRVDHANASVILLVLTTAYPSLALVPTGRIHAVRNGPRGEADVRFIRAPVCTAT
jgi:hypothetical protein